MLFSSLCKTRSCASIPAITRRTKVSLRYGARTRSESVLATCCGAVRSFLDTREKETSYGGDSRRLTRVSLGFGLVPHLYRKAWHALKLARVASDEHSPVGKGRGSDE